MRQKKQENSKNTFFLLPNTHENTHDFTLKCVLGTVESLKTRPLLCLISGGLMGRTIANRKSVPVFCFAPKNKCLVRGVVEEGF